MILTLIYGIWIYMVLLLVYGKKHIIGVYGNFVMLTIIYGISITIT